VCACNLSYPVCNGHNPLLYSYLRPVWLYHIFPHYLIKARFSEKKVTEHKICVSSFSTTFVWKISHCKKTRACYYHTFTYYAFMWCTRYSCQFLMKVEFSRQIFEKYSNTKFHENLFKRIRVLPCGRIERHEEANSFFSQFCERAIKKDRSTASPVPFEQNSQISITQSERHAIWSQTYYVLFNLLLPTVLTWWAV
jgi:hypothetical protein